MSRRVAMVLTGTAGAEQTSTALKLADRLLARGHRVAVFAHERDTALSAGKGELARAVGGLLRRGVHGGTLDWVVDAAGAERHGVAASQVPGVVPGDHSDLWAFVRQADLVLSVGGTG